MNTGAAGQQLSPNQNILDGPAGPSLHNRKSLRADDAKVGGLLKLLHGRPQPSCISALLRSYYALGSKLHIHHVYISLRPFVTLLGLKRIRIQHAAPSLSAEPDPRTWRPSAAPKRVHLATSHKLKLQAVPRLATIMISLFGILLHGTSKRLNSTAMAGSTGCCHRTSARIRGASHDWEAYSDHARRSSGVNPAVR